MRPGSRPRARPSKRLHGAGDDARRRLPRPRPPRPLPGLLGRHGPRPPAPRWELIELVNSDELLDTAGLDAGVVRPREMPATGLTFLPSRHGSGYTATISGYWGQHEPDGWVPEGYGDLRGIAIEPDRDALAGQAWLRAVVRRLRGQGVLFLSMAKARAYLAGNEAAYWTWRAGGTPLSMFVRRAAPWQRLLWRVLPRDRELAARRGAEPHDRANRPDTVGEFEVCCLFTAPMALWPPRHRHWERVSSAS